MAGLEWLKAGLLSLLKVLSFQIADSKKAPLGRFFTLMGRAG